MTYVEVVLGPMRLSSPSAIELSHLECLMTLDAFRYRVWDAVMNYQGN